MEEDHSQGDYAAFMSESSQSRVEKVNELEELQNTKASLSASLTKSKEELAVRGDQRRRDGEGDQVLCIIVVTGCFRISTLGRRPVLVRLRH